MFAQDCACERKTEQHFLDGSAFAMVIIRAETLMQP